MPHRQALITSIIGQRFVMCFSHRYRNNNHMKLIIRSKRKSVPVELLLRKILLRH